MPAVRAASYQFDAGFPFRGTAPVFFKAERRIAADLTDPRQFGQHLNFASPEFLLALSFQLLLQQHHFSVIQLLLLFSKTRVTDFLDLIREVLQDIALLSPQDKRRDHPAQLCLRLFILVFHDRRLKRAAERIVAVQKPRHQKIEDAPQLAQPVFNRRAGQREAGGCLQQLHGFSGGRTTVLDILRFVHNRIAEPDLLIRIDVPLQQIKRCNQHIRRNRIRRGLLHICQKSPSLLLRPCYGHSGEARCETVNFGFPVINKRRRTYHDGDRPRSSRFPLSQQDRDHLNRFSQSHLIGQNSAETVSVQHSHPSEPGFLIAAKRCRKSGRNRILGVADCPESPYQRPEMRIPVGIDRIHLFHHPVNVQGAVSRKIHMSTDKFTRRKLKRVHHLRKTGYRVLRVFLKGNERTAFQPVIFLFLQLIRQQQLEQFLFRDIRARYIQIEQIVLKRHADVHLHMSRYAKPFEPLGAPDFTDREQRIHTAAEKTVKVILVRAEKQIPYRIIFRKIAHHCVQRKALLLLITIRLRRSLRQQIRHILSPASIPRRNPRNRHTIYNVKIEYNLGLRRQIGQNLLFPLLADRHGFFQIRQRLVIEVRQMKTSDPGFKMPRLRMLRQRAQTPEAFRIHSGNDTVPNAVRAVLTHNRVRQITGYLHAGEFLSLLQRTDGELRLEIRPGGGQMHAPLLLVIRYINRFDFQVLFFKAAIKTVQPESVKREAVREIHSSVRIIEGTEPGLPVRIMAGMHFLILYHIPHKTVPEAAVFIQLIREKSRLIVFPEPVNRTFLHLLKKFRYVFHLIESRRLPAVSETERELHRIILNGRTGKNRLLHTRSFAGCILQNSGRSCYTLIKKPGCGEICRVSISMLAKRLNRHQQNGRFMLTDIAVAECARIVAMPAPPA